MDNERHALENLQYYGKSNADAIIKQGEIYIDSTQKLIFELVEHLHKISRPITARPSENNENIFLRNVISKQMKEAEQALKKIKCYATDLQK